ncbi:MAG: 2OG-Fe(II) oxygenase [Actinomycetota bacterium]
MRRYPAPILLVDDVIDEPLRQQLFGAFEAGPTFESPMPTTDGGLEPDPSTKVRTDFVLDGDLLEEVAYALHERLLPALEHGFSFQAMTFEQIKMVAYPVGGHFHAHRDVVGPDTAHRRFAVTINLDDGYSGGGLRFCEFQPTEFVPAPGAAIAFSCALLHEVLPVTAGRRHALITFLS